jgi:hypothetical protein
MIVLAAAATADAGWFDGWDCDFHKIRSNVRSIIPTMRQSLIAVKVVPLSRLDRGAEKLRPNCRRLDLNREAAKIAKRSEY